jgi:hypothetical protein
MIGSLIVWVIVIAAVSIAALAFGLLVFPDITTFAWCGALGVMFLVLLLAVFGPLVTQHIEGAAAVVALSMLVSLLALAKHRANIATQQAHLYDKMKGFVHSMRRDEGRYQRHMMELYQRWRKANPTLAAKLDIEVGPWPYQPGKPSMRARMVVPVHDWGWDVDWTNRPMDTNSSQQQREATIRWGK